MDEEHKRLFALINQLHEAMGAGKGKEVVGGILDELGKYAQTHFSHEEKLMTASKYPDYAKQKSAHDAFIVKVQQMQQQHKSGQLMMSMQVMSFLKDWLTNHIMGMDRNYGPYLNSKGVN
jgi:hemerythrin-like metal-binding protein